MTETDTKFYEELKNTRNSKKISLKEISEYTKINVKIFKQIIKILYGFSGLVEGLLVV